MGVVFTPLNRFSADNKERVSRFFILFNIFQFHQYRRRTPREVPFLDSRTDNFSLNSARGLLFERDDVAENNRRDFPVTIISEVREPPPPLRYCGD